MKKSLFIILAMLPLLAGCARSHVVDVFYWISASVIYGSLVVGMAIGLFHFLMVSVGAVRTKRQRQDYAKTKN
jgi:hypothetical protein